MSEDGPTSSAPAGGRTPTRRLSPAARREAIVAAGTEVFTQLGYQGTSLEDIAAHLGVTRPLIYHYFSDKDALYLEVLTRARTALDDALLAAIEPDQSPLEQLTAGIRAYFTFVADHAHHWDLLYGGGTAVAGAVAEHATLLRFETSEKIGLLLSAAAPHLDELTATAYAHAVSGAGEALSRWWRHHPEVPLEQVIESHLTVVWHGLAAVAEPPTPAP